MKILLIKWLIFLIKVLFETAKPLPILYFLRLIKYHFWQHQKLSFKKNFDLRFSFLKYFQEKRKSS